LPPLALFFSAQGRIAPKPFAVGVIAVYVTTLLAQLLLSPPVIGHGGLALFAFVQTLAIWSWFCLHAKRLRDGGRGVGAAVAIAILYGLAVVLFLLLVALIAEPIPKDATNAPSAHLADFFVLLLPLALLTGDPIPGLFAYVVMAVVMLILIPILMAIGFSIFAFGRPSITAARLIGTSKPPH
jgi:uncharacterized membrane protein YhaH (DUF805 family)